MSTLNSDESNEEKWITIGIISSTLCAKNHFSNKSFQSIPKELDGPNKALFSMQKKTESDRHGKLLRCVHVKVAVPSISNYCICAGGRRGLNSARVSMRISQSMKLLGLHQLTIRHYFLKQDIFITSTIISVINAFQVFMSWIMNDPNRHSVPVSNIDLVSIKDLGITTK